MLLALEKLAEMPRQEYESALPDLGSMLALVDVCRIARLNRRSSEKNRRLHYFTCDYCGFSESGFYVPTDPRLEEKRFCRSFYGKLGTAEILERKTICGHEMRVERFVSADEERTA